MSNITIVGTSHIARESVANVTNTIRSVKPTFVAVELDHKRLFGLLHTSRKRPSIRESIRQFGVQGYVFALIGEWLEKKLGQHVGVLPGSDMLAAVHAAKETNARLLLIDQDLHITLRQFSKRVPLKEKFQLVIDILRGVLGKDDFTLDLAKVPTLDIIDTLLYRIRKRYPTLYDVLVHKRNIVMARRLIHIIQTEPTATVVAVVGAGHQKELLKLVEEYQRHATKTT